MALFGKTIPATVRTMRVTVCHARTKIISRPIRPPDLIIQDEFHLISGPLGTMVDFMKLRLTSWQLGLNEQAIKPKVIASTATVRKAAEQMTGVFNREVSIFQPAV